MIEYLLAFSCRGRWFCPSCHNKKMVQFGHYLKETILYPAPHLQYVFSNQTIFHDSRKPSHLILPVDKDE